MKFVPSEYQYKFTYICSIDFSSTGSTHDITSITNNKDVYMHDEKVCTRSAFTLYD